MKRIKKFVTIGPESTGKSTLCQLLAEHYETLWCPEFARQYLEEHGTDYSYNDLLHIAKGQINLEKKTTLQLKTDSRSDLLFVDTDMYVMRVWCEYVFGDCYKMILDVLAENECDGYFLCAPDLPWEEDGMREYPDQKVRDELFLYYKEMLTAQHVPWIVISGDHDERLNKATSFIDGLVHP